MGSAGNKEQNWAIVEGPRLGDLYLASVTDKRMKTIGILRLRLFSISREPRTSRSHVTRALPLGLRFDVHVCTARPRSGGKRLPQGLLHPKTSQSHVWEERRLFRTLLLIDNWILFFKNRNFEDNFSAKIEVSGWKKTKTAAASYHPRILNPKFGQTGKVDRRFHCVMSQVR